MRDSVGFKTGAGVSWLHVRIGNRPKYYVFEPFRNLG